MTCEPLTVGPLTEEEDLLLRYELSGGGARLPRQQSSAPRRMPEVRRVEFSLRPLTAHCAEVAALTRHVAIGLSPFNGYFSRTRIAELAAWSARAYPRVDFWVPDSVAGLTLQAAGYTRVHADRRAGEESRRLRNQALRFLEGHRADATSHVRALSSLSDQRQYQALLADVTELYNDDADFRASCRSASRDVVLRHTGRGNVSDKGVSIATRYLLAELPLYSHGDQLFDVPHSVQVYHCATPFFEALYAYELAWKPSPNQGFAVMAVKIG